MFISCIRVFERSVVIRGQAVRMGGIGEVATHPLHRNKGYAAMLLRDCERFMADNRSDCQMIFNNKCINYSTTIINFVITMQRTQWSRIILVIVIITEQYDWFIFNATMHAHVIRLEWSFPRFMQQARWPSFIARWAGARWIWGLPVPRYITLHSQVVRLSF